MICLVTFGSGVGILTATFVMAVVAVGATATVASARLLSATTAALTASTKTVVSALSVL
jgi:hypothetical protein